MRLALSISQEAENMDHHQSVFEDHEIKELRIRTYGKRIKWSNVVNFKILIGFAYWC